MCVCVCVNHRLCVQRCVRMCTMSARSNVQMNETEKANLDTNLCGTVHIMYQNNESHLSLLTFWGCCLHFAALCINTHGFNNLGSGVVIDPVGHSPPFLISSSSAWGSAFPMSLHIYILQHSHECKEVNGHKLYYACSAQRHQPQMTALRVPNNMEEIRLQSTNGSISYTHCDCLTSKM